MSLDDIINKGPGRAPGGRRPAGGAERGRASGGSVRRAPAGQARARAAPYARGGGARRNSGNDDGHMANASVGDVANSEDPVLKVKSDSKPNTVAGAICNVVREARGKAPAVLATGPQAINQAMKAVAIARKYLLEEDTPVDLMCTPTFEQDVRSGSNVRFELEKTKKPLSRSPLEEDLAVKDTTDVFKLAGAIAGRVRDGEEVAITTKGPVPVLIAIKALATAQEYVAEENLGLKFAVSIVDLENPEIRGETSTYLHFAIVAFDA